MIKTNINSNPASETNCKNWFHCTISNILFAIQAINKLPVKIYSKESVKAKYHKFHILHYLSLIPNDTTLKSKQPVIIYYLNIYGGIMYEINQENNNNPFN